MLKFTTFGIFEQFLATHCSKMPKTGSFGFQHYQMWLFTKMAKYWLFYCGFWHFSAIFNKTTSGSSPKYEIFNPWAVHVCTQPRGHWWNGALLLCAKILTHACICDEGMTNVSICNVCVWCGRPTWKCILYIIIHYVRFSQFYWHFCKSIIFAIFLPKRHPEFAL